MKLVATESGRIVQLVSPDEVRPLRGFDLPTLVHGISTRYGFAKVPETLDTFTQPKGLRFEQGRFSSPSKDGMIPVLDFSLFNDGVIAACADTDLTDMMLDDFFSWVVAATAMRKPQTLKQRQYVSNLVVQLDRASSTRMDTMFKTTSVFNAALKDQYGWDNTSTLGRLAFSVDPKDVTAQRAAPFIIERRANVPYEMSYFWSSAPLPTSAHLALIEALENEIAN